MLHEYIRYLTAKASGYARDLGYLKESIAFEARAQNSKSSWQEHFKNCHAEVLRQTEGLSPGSTVWIMGSGSLFETPWQALLKKSLFLKLVDIYHPAHVKKIASNHSKIELIESDMTGFQNLTALQKILLKVPEPPHLPIQPQDFVISSNIWSQLPIFPLEYLSKNTEISEEEKIQWAKSLQKSHLEWITSFGGSGMILSDFEMHYLNTSRYVTRIEQQPLRPQNLKKINQWDWKWDHRVIRKVEVYTFSKKN